MPNNGPNANQWTVKKNENQEMLDVALFCKKRIPTPPVREPQKKIGCYTLSQVA